MNLGRWPAKGSHIIKSVTIIHRLVPCAALTLDLNDLVSHETLDEQPRDFGFGGPDQLEAFDPLFALTFPHPYSSDFTFGLAIPIARSFTSETVPS